MAISQNQFMLSVHMSDNGLRPRPYFEKDKDLFLEILDMFGLDESCLCPQEDLAFKINNKI